MANQVCSDCWRWEAFKADCNFHWEGKRECSRWMQHELDEEKHRTVIDSSYLF